MALPLSSSASTALRPLVPLVVVTVAGVAIARTLATARLDHALLFAGALAVFMLAFMRTEFGLYLVVFSMLLSPEFTVGGGLAERRDVIFRSEDFLLLVISFSWLAKMAVNKDLGLVLKTPLNRPIAVYIVTTAIATTVGYAAGTVRTAAGFFYVLKYVEYFFVYYMVVNHVGDRRELRRLLVAALATAAIASVIGIMQIPAGQRVSAPFEGAEGGEPNTFGGYLLFMMALVLGIALETTRARMRIAMLALGALYTVPFMFTLSRASYLGFVPMLLTASLLSRRRKFAVAIIVLALLLSPVLVWLTPDAVMKRVTHTFQPEYTSPTVRLGKLAFDPSTSARVLSMRQALEGWLDRPILGHGVTGFLFMDAQYARTLAETGIVGFAAFAWLVFRLFKSSRHAYRAATDADERGLALGFIAGTVALLVHAIGSNTFIIIRIMEPFWLLAGLIVLLPMLAARPASGGPPVAPARARHDSPTFTPRSSFTPGPAS